MISHKKILIILVLIIAFIIAPNNVTAAPSSFEDTNKQTCMCYYNPSKNNLVTPTEYDNAFGNFPFAYDWYNTTWNTKIIGTTSVSCSTSINYEYDYEDITATEKSEYIKKCQTYYYNLDSKTIIDPGAPTEKTGTLSGAPEECEKYFARETTTEGNWIKLEAYKVLYNQKNCSPWPSLIVKTNNTGCYGWDTPTTYEKKLSNYNTTNDGRKKAAVRAQCLTYLKNNYNIPITAPSYTPTPTPSNSSTPKPAAEKGLSDKDYNNTAPFRGNNEIVIVDDCEDIIDTELLKYLQYLFLMIKFLVPSLLVILGSFDLGKAALANDEKKIKESTTRLVKRIGAGLSIFLVIAFLEWFIKWFPALKGVTWCGLD